MPRKGRIRDRSQPVGKGRPLPPQWRRDWHKFHYYAVLNAKATFTTALEDVFQELERLHGAYLFRGIGADLDRLLKLLVEAIVLSSVPLSVDLAAKCEHALLHGGRFDYPEDNENVQAWTDEERTSFDATRLQDLIDAVARHPKHPWSGRVKQPPEEFRRQNPVDRAWWEATFQAIGDPDWRAAALEEVRKHNAVWPDAGPEVQAIVTDFCRHHALPTLPPLDDGQDDVWLTYREWRPVGGAPALSIRQKWVISGPPPTLSSAHLELDESRLRPAEVGHPEPETVYPPILVPIRFSPREKTIDEFMDEVDAAWARARGVIYQQARELARQAKPYDWRPLNSGQRDAATITVHADWLYRHVTENLTPAQLVQSPDGTLHIPRSTVYTAIRSLAGELGVDLSPGARRSR